MTPDAFETWAATVPSVVFDGHDKRAARAAWDAATERAAKVVAKLAAECNPNDVEEAFGFNRLKRAESSIRGGQP